MGFESGSGIRRQGGAYGTTHTRLLALSLIVFCALAFAVATGAAEAADRTLLHIAVSHAGPPLVEAMRWTSAAGSVEAATVFGTLAAALLWLSGRKLPAALLMATVAAGLGVTAGVKEAFHRARPVLGSGAASFSFPSGHTLMTTCVSGSLASVLRRVRKWSRRTIWVLAACVWSALVGVSRVVLGAHHPSDVAAGYALAASVLIVMHMADCRLGGMLE